MAGTELSSDRAGTARTGRLARGLRRLPLAPRPIALRIVCVLLALPVLWVTAAGLVLLDVAAREGGWLPSALVFAAPLLVLTTGLGIGRRWWQRMAVVLVLAIALGAWTYRTSPPVPERLAGVAREVGVPAGWHTVDAQAGGSTWGLFGDYPRYDAEYTTAEPAPDAMSRYTALLEADGWERYDPLPDYQPPAGIEKTHWRRERWLLSVTVQAPDSPWRRDEARPTLTEVDVHVGYF